MGLLLTPRRASSARAVALLSGVLLPLLMLGLASPGAIGAQPASRRARRSRPPVTTFRVDVSLAQEGRRPVVSRGWLREQLRRANRLFQPHGVGFELGEQRPLPARHARMESRGDRHALGALLRPERINLFIVASLRDVDEPERYRMGVHWRPRGEGIAEGAHLVIVSQIAAPTVLAHELGHFFGNRHSQVPGNIMSYERGDTEPFFDRDQSRRIRRFSARFVETGELVPVSSETSPN